jgi:hypothetical protein
VNDVSIIVVQFTNTAGALVGALLGDQVGTSGSVSEGEPVKNNNG